MFEVANIGTYNNNYKLYEVTIQNKQKKSKYLEKSTYIVANDDADKFEDFYKKENLLLDEKNALNNRKEEKIIMRKLKNGSTLGAIIGAGLPLSIFAFTKKKTSLAVKIIAPIAGAVIGYFSGLALAMAYILDRCANVILKNLSEFKKLDIKKIKHERQKIA